MNLYFRLLILMFRALMFKQFQNPLLPTRCSFRVLPNDLDFNFHMNNGRYLTLMDLARLDYMAQIGIFYPALKRKWLPILGETQMSFFKSLNPFQKFEIETKLESWDDKWFVMTQNFYCKGKLVASGRIRGLLRGPEGNINPKEILALANFDSRQTPDNNETGEIWLKYVNLLRESFSKKKVN